jgi:hypothetical protein
MLGDPATTSDEEFRSAIRTEYTALRSQIEKADGVCQLALAAAFTAGLAMAKVATDATTSKAAAAPTVAQSTILDSAASGAAFLISVTWLAAYLFLSEKRHVIVKTAYYISSELEPRHPGLGWERWHLGGAMGQSFWRWDPHYLETIVSTAVLALVFALVWSLEGAHVTVWVGLNVLIDLTFAWFAFRSIKNYRRAVWLLKHPGVPTSP